MNVKPLSLTCGCLDASCFCRNPQFAKQALDAILDTGYTVPLVLTQPDRPAGRGIRLRSPVKQPRRVSPCQPRSLRLDGKYLTMPPTPDKRLSRRGRCDGGGAYGLMCPNGYYAAPRLPEYHASLLPRWREPL